MKRIATAILLVALSCSGCKEPSMEVKQAEIAASERRDLEEIVKLLPTGCTETAAVGNKWYKTKFENKWFLCHRVWHSGWTAEMVPLKD